MQGPRPQDSRPPTCSPGWARTPVDRDRSHTHTDTHTDTHTHTEAVAKVALHLHPRRQAQGIHRGKVHDAEALREAPGRWPLVALPWPSVSAGLSVPPSPRSFASSPSSPALDTTRNERISSRENRCVPGKTTGTPGSLGRDADAVCAADAQASLPNRNPPAAKLPSRLLVFKAVRQL